MDSGRPLFKFNLGLVSTIYTKVIYRFDQGQAIQNRGLGEILGFLSQFKVGSSSFEVEIWI